VLTSYTDDVELDLWPLQSGYIRPVALARSVAANPSDSTDTSARYDVLTGLGDEGVFLSEAKYSGGTGQRVIWIHGQLYCTLEIMSDGPGGSGVDFEAKARAFALLVDQSLP
jgi:hypothetical protein